MIEVENMAEGWDGEELEDIVDDDRDLFTQIYVETSTNLIHEVHMFDNFCLVRLASPNFYSDIRKFSHVEFAREFHEYDGDLDAVHEMLRGSQPDFIVS